MIKVISLEKKGDRRGMLAEITPAIPGQFKHCFIATINPGFTRGNHYHKRKTEWVLVTEGSVEVSLIDVITHKKEVTQVSYEDLLLIEIPQHKVVQIANRSNEKATILAIFDEEFDPKDPDVWVQ